MTVIRGATSSQYSGSIRRHHARDYQNGIDREFRARKTGAFYVVATYGRCCATTLRRHRREGDGCRWGSLILAREKTEQFGIPNCKVSFYTCSTSRAQMTFDITSCCCYIRHTHILIHATTQLVGFLLMRLYNADGGLGLRQGNSGVAALSSPTK